MSNSAPALDIVKEPRFNTLRNVVKDNIDIATVKYPVGLGNCAMSLKDFYERYSQQTDNKVSYLVNLPISVIQLMQGSIRLVRPEFCVDNFKRFKYSIDFCESENPVVFFDEKENFFFAVKKQHTLTQLAAIADVKGEDIGVVCRVVAFASSVSTSDRIIQGSQLFYREVQGINSTKDWEALPHQVQLGEESAVLTKKFYDSIKGLTYQPIDHPFPLISEANYSCTKVREVGKLVRYAVNDDKLDMLELIVQTVCNSVNWDAEPASKEVSVYLIRALYNVDKVLQPMLDDAVGGLGYNFDIVEHIETFFSRNNRISRYLGTTGSDKSAWQHLVKAANHVNNTLIESGQIENPYFRLRNKTFVHRIVRFANPNKNSSVSEDDVASYIKVFCPDS